MEMQSSPVPIRASVPALRSMMDAVRVGAVGRRDVLAVHEQQALRTSQDRWATLTAADGKEEEEG
jgi:hypothetical protein